MTSGDEEMIAGTCHNRKSYKRILSSSDDDPEEDEQKSAKKDINNFSDSHSECLLQKPCSSNKSFKSIRKNIYTVESSDDDDEGERNNDKNKKDLRRKNLEEMARKKRSGRKKKDEHTEEDWEFGNYDKADSMEEEEEETPYLIEKTRVFTAKFTKLCDLPDCSRYYIKDVTKVVGVRIFDPSINNYTGLLRDGEEQNYWVCASHSKFHNEESNDDDKEEFIDKDSESDSITENEDMEDFIDDDCESDVNNSAEYKEILSRFARRTQKDKDNKDNYMKEHAKYQLKIHSASNPGLHLRPEKRYERNTRTAKFDKGLKDDRGIEALDPEYQDTEDIFVFGEKVKIFRKSKKISYYSQSCGLPKCQNIFTENVTEVIEAMIRSGGRIRLNSRQKSFYICYSHVSEYKNQKTSDSDQSHSDESY